MAEALSKSWYALTVKPRHERTASDYLRGKGLEEFSPVYRSRRRWSDRIKEVDSCLFPGYVFCRFGYEDRLRVLGTPGIASIVSFAGTPVPIPDAEISAIQSLIRSGRRIEPWPYLRLGASVRIEEGCFEGLSGKVVRETDGWRIVVSVELLQRSVAVEIDRAAVRTVPETCTGPHALL